MSLCIAFLPLHIQIHFYKCPSHKKTNKQTNNLPPVSQSERGFSKTDYSIFWPHSEKKKNQKPMNITVLLDCETKMAQLSSRGALFFLWSEVQMKTAQMFFEVSSYVFCEIVLLSELCPPPSAASENASPGSVQGGECGDWREKDAFCLLNTHSLITAEYAH